MATDVGSLNKKAIYEGLLMLKLQCSHCVGDWISENKKTNKPNCSGTMVEEGYVFVFCFHAPLKIYSSWVLWETESWIKICLGLIQQSCYYVLIIFLITFLNMAF